MWARTRAGLLKRCARPRGGRSGARSAAPLAARPALAPRMMMGIRRAPPAGPGMRQGRARAPHTRAARRWRRTWPAAISASHLPGRAQPRAPASVDACPPHPTHC